jgi:uncharacterized Zn finger protein (UPF0148 family)
MIYCCEICHFLFKRVGTVDACPDCGKSSVREATDDEREEFNRRQDNQS